MWGALSDERTGLSFTTAAAPRQRSHSVSDSGLPFSSPPTTRRATVEVFDAASTRDMNRSSLHGSLYSLSVTLENVCCLAVVTEMCLPNRCLSMDFRVCSLLRERVFGEPLASNGLPLWLHYSGRSGVMSQYYTSDLMCRRT
jgi:hypothetical protein